MSVIHVGHIKTEVLNRFSSLVDIADVATAPNDQKEMTRLTRALAAFVLAELGGLDDVGSAQGVTDGTGDNGIDAVYFDAAEKTASLSKQNGLPVEMEAWRLATCINSSRE